jgi:hypothetical protein
MSRRGRNRLVAPPQSEAVIAERTVWLRRRPTGNDHLSTYQTRRLALVFPDRHPGSLTSDELVGFIAGHQWNARHPRS